jgi:putative nucleotidyltransferase with HDIG domain
LSLRLKFFIGLVVTLCAAALALATLNFPPPSSSDSAFGLVFWVLATAVACAAPVRLPRGLRITVATTPILASAFLLGPAAGGWVALIGCTELREVRRQIPWYGTAFNHAAIALPAVVAGYTFRGLVGTTEFAPTPTSFAAAAAAGLAYVALNFLMTGLVVTIREHRSLRSVYVRDIAVVATSMVALVPLAWLMAHVYHSVGFWAAVLFALPLYTTRAAYATVVEIRDMFTQTVKALASAIDARDPKTAQHSARVATIAVDIGQVLGCSQQDLEHLEWGGLLHDIGKIGVHDDILLKAGPLRPEEWLAMRKHPVTGERILLSVERLADERPVIRHHHEWYDGSGYPDGLAGERIPFLARVLHVADAYEAMTAVRPYRLHPLTQAQAIAELERSSGIEFDPIVVAAFRKTRWADHVRPAKLPAELEPSTAVGDQIDGTGPLPPITVAHGASPDTHSRPS